MHRVTHWAGLESYASNLAAQEPPPRSGDDSMRLDCVDGFGGDCVGVEILRANIAVSLTEHAHETSDDAHAMFARAIAGKIFRKIFRPISHVVRA